MTEEAGRPQDQERRHRAKGRPSTETRRLLAQYQAAMRDELRALLAEIEPRPPAAGLGLVNDQPKRLPVADRARLWDLAIKLGRELGSEIDPTPLASEAPARRAPRSRRIDFG